MSDTDRPCAMVTGASSGLGAAFAERLAQDGHDLILAARRLDRLDALAERLNRSHGARVETLRADLNDSSDLTRVEAALTDGTPTLLVNCAGFPGYYPFVAIDPKVIDDLIGVHIRAVTRTIRAALPGMIRRGAGGVINV